MRLGLVTGEASGDLIVRDALVGLSQRHPQLALEGVGGPALTELGMDCWASSEALAVRGYVEVLQRLPSLLRLRSSLAERWLRRPPALFLGVDAPDFNLSLEARLKAAGIPTAHLVSPSIWAWRPERVHQIARSVDHMLCLFPMEPALYAGTGVTPHYVGHPLADLVPATPMGSSRSATRPVLALLPGSRQAEIARLGPIFLEVARAFSTTHQLLLPVASEATRAQIQQLPNYPQLRDLGLVLMGPESPEPGRPASHLVLEAASLALVASGTATLEAALYGVPQVVAYQVPWLTEKLMRRKAIVQHVSLPNLLLGRALVPEFLQAECEPRALGLALRAWQDDPARVAAYQEDCLQLLHSLRRGAAGQVAATLEELLG